MFDVRCSMLDVRCSHLIQPRGTGPTDSSPGLTPETLEKPVARPLLLSSASTGRSTSTCSGPDTGLGELKQSVMALFVFLIGAPPVRSKGASDRGP
jgi:hypothetical protein